MTLNNANVLDSTRVDEPDLATVDPRKSRIVELRFFGGLTLEETATVLGVSSDTVMRDWKVARAWLRREMARVTRVTR